MSRLKKEGGDWDMHSHREEETELYVWQAALECACSIQFEITWPWETYLLLYVMTHKRDA